MKPSKACSELFVVMPKNPVDPQKIPNSGNSRDGNSRDSILILALFWFSPGFSGPQSLAKQVFQVGHKRHIAQRATCLLMLADVVHFRRRYRLRQEIPPVAFDDRKQGSHIHQIIILTGYMGAGAAPSPLFRPSNQFRPNRIVLNISATCQQINLIHHERRKSLLPKVSTPAFPEIDTTGISSMCLPNGRPEILFLSRYGD